MPSSMSFGMKVYLGFFRFVFSVFGTFLVGSERWSETKKAQPKLAALARDSGSRPRIWFHAASVGELESLWPLVEFANADGKFDLVLTVFSTSAWGHVHRMARKLEGAPPLFVGYSPLEGDWLTALSAIRPELFVTAKYEAWPDIWNSLACLDIPLAIIGAKPRSSILWAKRILNLVSGKIPKIRFFSFDRENQAGLAEAFPDAFIKHGSDPRWDRVFQRSGRRHPRVDELTKEFADLPHPWAVIGSAWATDLSEIPANGADSYPGTFWIIPHKVDPKSVSEIEILLRERGWTPVRTGSDEKIRPAGKICVLVDEMGFLAELYSVMDWAWIGGGFGSSVHSTIEPAIYGLPLLAGPNGREKFDEISLLQKQGQLQIVERKSAERSLPALIKQFSKEVAPELRERWRELNRGHQGTSRRIWEDLLSCLERPT